MTEALKQTPSAVCPVCGTVSTTPRLVAMNKHGRHVLDADEQFHLYSCASCDALFVAGIQADDSFYRRYYDSSYYEENPPKGLRWATGAATWLAALSHAKKTRLCRQMTRHVGHRIRLLDIGCGSGDFLASLDRSLFDAQGLEISEDGRQRCGQRGLTVTSTPIETADFAGQRFDVITLWHVLEHLPHPADTLRAARSHLAAKGVLILAVPNHHCLGFHLGAADWFHLDSPRHLFLPSRQTVERLASDAGLRVVSCHHQWFECPLDLWWSVRSSPHRWWVRAWYPLVKRFSAETLQFVLRAPL